MGEAWVTFAHNEAEVGSALTLCFSLKKSFTSRKVAVITSRKLGIGLRNALYHGFDLLLYQEDEWNTAGLSDEEFAKVFALTLKSFEKVVFLSPKMLAIKNCDEIFDNYDVSSGFVWTKEEGMSVFMIRPSLPAFRVLSESLEKKNGIGVEQFLRKWIKNQYHTEKEIYLSDKYNRVLTSQGGLLLEEEVSIVNLTGFSLNKNSENLGFFAELIVDEWNEIYNTKVNPLMETYVTGKPGMNSLHLTPTYPREPIVITGMACRYPGANSVEEFWNLLINSEDGTGNPPDYRWLDEHSEERRKINAGFLKYPVEEFDSKFFGISPKEMLFLDPQHRLLHELVWEGLEDAAVNPQGLRGSNGGVFIGSWTNDYQNILNDSGNKDYYRSYMGNSIGAAAARISFLLGWTGPSIATESGCSSAMVAVHLACRSLQQRETNLALAAGVNLLLKSFDEDVMPMALSPEGRCKTFDAKADGFGRAEGCGVLVLKRLSDAVRDGDKIWALIRGSGMSQEGVSKSMGTPTVHCESMAMKQALKDAGVDPKDVSYVEAHGTGTVVGDPLEIAAIAKAYYSSQRKEPLLIGSVKTNVGHTESCSGITGIMKVVLAMQNEIIPPHRNFETLNPSIDLEAVPATISLVAVDWKKKQGNPRISGVSSFGITGTDAHVILEEPPTLHANALQSNKTLERPLHIMKITAKSDEAMNILLENYKNRFTTTESSLADLAYTANIGRADFNQRAVLIAKSNEDAIQIIEKNKLLKGEESADSLGKVCFLFTGQGSQYPGMAKQLYETSPVFRMHFEYCQKILRNNYGIDITQVLWSKEKSTEVSRTIYSQTSIFCVEYGLLKLWESWGVKADFALGHSLGEFAAAVCSGILTVEDAIKLVAERSRLIDDLPRGKMLVIKAEKKQVDTLMKKFASGDSNRILDYAAVNSPEQTVVAGDSEIILQFSEACKKSQLKCIVLEATHAFHSKHMDPMLDAYRSVAKTVKKLGGNDSKYISGMRGSVVEADNVDAEYWVQHTREKVLFLNASKKAVELGCRTFIEIGPQPVLSALTMMNNNGPLTCFPSLKRNEQEWETLLTSLGKLYVKGMEIDWKGLDNFYNREKVSLPHYPFIGKPFWPDMQRVAGSTIHPLVGSVISNASSTKLFQSGLNTEALDYVKDHAIGDNVIFPGAGYLEMCLAAGLATVEGSSEALAPPTRAMKVENLVIEAPLALQDSKTAKVQTVVELNTSKENGGDWNDMKISIFRKMESESGKWLPHAKATFSPIPTAEEKAVSFNIEAFTQTLTKPSNDEFIQEIYHKLASVGLKFGPNFQSLETVWRDEKKGTLLAKVKVPSGESSNQPSYIIHPVVLDAMIQAIMMLRLTSNLKKKLYVPIKIEKFIWLSSPSENSTSIYIHAFESDTNSASDTALLVDSTGKLLAVMSSVEFIETTVKAIDSVLEQQTSSMADLWEEIWKTQVGPLQHRVDLLKTRAHCSELGLTHDDYNKPSAHLSSLFCDVEQLVYFNMLRCLYECGWEPELGNRFSEEALHFELRIQNTYRKYLSFLLEVLEMEGILMKETVANFGREITWKVVKMPPSFKEVKATLFSPAFTSELTSRYSTTPLFTKVGENLSKILTGKQPALNILFPEENQGYPSVAEFYTTYDQVFQLRQLVLYIGVKRVMHMKAQMGEQRFILKLLEVGAGTGSYSDAYLRVLEESGIEFEYTYTDISAAFFSAAEKRFEKYGKRLSFKKLNIEEDPIDQGFTPEYYDLVCASDVIHTTKNIKDTLGNMRMLMKPGGMLDIQELTGVHRFVTFLFGLLEGFWRFEDLELRPRHCTLSGGEWTRVLKECGFEVDGLFSVLNNYHSFIWAVKGDEVKMESRIPAKQKSWLVFQGDNENVSEYVEKRLRNTTTRKVVKVRFGESFKEEQGGNSFMIRKNVEQDFEEVFKCLKSLQINLEGIIYCWALKASERTSQEDILRPYFHLTKSLLTADFPGSPRLIAVTNSTIPVGDTGLSGFPCSTLWGFTKSLKNENIGMDVKFVDLEDGPWNESQLEELFCELWKADKESIIAYREGARCFPKITPHKPIKNSLQLPPGTDRFQLVLPESRSISDLQFGTLDNKILKEDEVEVQIKASALNFRDVLSVIKPSEDFKDINTVGFDFAGVIKKVGAKVRKWQVGDRVCGCNIYFTALPSHVTLNEDLLLSVPEDVTFCEAATMPAVYITSVLCLVDVAKIKKGDVVLIHTATGGVGLSAIEICKHFGCTIIATAGSKRKQNYLRNLGIQHIFHSRNTKYGDQILELTNGRGVDVVLNSLTSEGFKEATLKACAKGARFVEMSKLSIWTTEEVKALRPDVEYTTIDVSTSDSSEWKRLLGNLKVLQDENVVKPIPYSRFDALNIRDALQHMQKAKHIGKIVCSMPELRQEQGKISVYTPMFNDRSTYLITGGLGGIGFVVCQWMVEKGAKHVILAGRSPPSSSIQIKMNELNSKGANVSAVQLDVSNFEQCKFLIQNQIENMGLPPIKGVMHAAGTLSDGLIVNQDWPKLSSTFRTKIDGSLNLHELTKNLNLEHFVVFSSIAALFGPPGQCNHAAGNQFEDALIHYRNSIGLPGTTVNWGQWGEVGIATEVDLPGFRTISNLQGIAGLEYTLNSQRTQLAVGNVDSFQIMSKLFPYLAICLDERVWKSSSSTASVAIKSNEFWLQIESKSELEERMSLVKEQLKNILRSVLKLDQSETINEQGNFQEMGVDSLMFVEIKNHLQNLVGDRVTINASSLKDCNTINLLAETLMKLIEGNDEMEKLAPPTMEQVSELIKEDCFLPEHIKAKPGQNAVALQDIKTILLAGCTGTLGTYVLKELTNLPQITRVICLMRPSKKEKVDERFKKVLESKNLISQVNMGKITCATGNVARPQLGMNSDVWDELSSSVDAVFNCSARVQHNEHYRKSKPQGDDVRAVNIGGLINILEFACEKKLKHVFQASSMIAVLSTDEQGRISEDWPKEGEYDGLTTFAYFISKYVGDFLTKIGVDRGIPCKVFRFPFIGGEEGTGQCEPEYNHVLMRYMFIMKNKMMPSVPFPMALLPVDMCASVSVRLFFEEKAPSDVYNVGIMKPDTDQEFLNVAAKFGHNVELVEFSEFAEKVKKEGHSALSMFTDFYSDEDAILSYFSSAQVIQRWVEGNEGVFMSEKVPKFIPNYYEAQRPPMDYIYKDLLFAKGKGWFEKFGL